MKKRLSLIAFTPIFLLLLVSCPVAQNRWLDKKCATRAYAASEVTRRAKIVEGPDFSRAREAFRNVHDQVRLDAVLCRSGQVTDIRIIEGSSPTVNEFVSSTVSLIRFVPAELNLHSVSQRIQFKFEIDDGQVKETTIRETTGRLVESVDIVGNRRLTAKQIFALIKTRAGEPYDEAQVQLDFKRLLATGQFDQTDTRVFTEEGARGGVGVYFFVHELPVIGNVTFEGLKIDPAVIREAWKDAQIYLQTGVPYSPEIGRAAVRVIKQVLNAKALGYSKVELRAELPNFQTVNLIFVISNQ